MASDASGAACARGASAARGCGLERLLGGAAVRPWHAATSKLACMPSKRCSRGSMSAADTASEPRCSISDSRRWASSPSRNAPASRALPLSVCRARSTASRALRLSGRAVHWRSAPPSWGISSIASSSKIGNRSGSIASTMSMSSWSSPKSATVAALSAADRAACSGMGVNTGATLPAPARPARAAGDSRRGGSTGGIGRQRLEAGEIAERLVLRQVRALRNRQLLQGLQGLDDARVRAPSGSRRRTGAAGAGFPRLPR